jgi:hypothetical protein
MFNPFPGGEVGAKSLSRLPGRITSGTHLPVSVSKIHRMKGLQKERVPINIEVDDNNTKGTLNDRRNCPFEYTHKRGRCNPGI